MAFRASQKAFDDAVQETVDCLGLPPEEATKEIIEQFKLQGVDVSLLAIDYVSDSDKQQIAKLVADLTAKTIPDEVVELLNLLEQECGKGVNHRVEAGKLGVYDSILSSYRKFDSLQVNVGCLKALLALMTKQPDLLTDEGCRLILANLDGESDPEVVKFALKWCKECCIMHEKNRQSLVGLRIVEKLKELLEKSRNSEVLREVLGVCRALILDDDVRVEFGKAHDHAKIIAGETLQLLIALLKKFKADENLINDLMMTLAAILVRSEFCKAVEEAGGLELIHDAMTHFLESEKINRQCFKLMKAMAGNDESKAHLIQKGLAPVIAKSLSRHLGKAQTASAGLGCVAALSLRCPDNSRAFFEAALPEIIVEMMKIHADDKAVQKAASWAIRNMVSRSRYQNQTFLELGVEGLLKSNLKKFKEIEYDTKAALRDLECSVELKEEWTGKGGKLTSDSGKMN